MKLGGDHGRRRLVIASTVLGIGLGGFFDGIVLHQILQWHHVISSPVPPDSIRNLELDTRADGLFHALTWLVTVIGVFLLASSDGARHAEGRRKLVGGLVMGWGLFNLVEGLIDHQILGLHHVRSGHDEVLYDLGFLVWGGLMIVIGLALLGGPGQAVAAETDVDADVDGSNGITSG
ncbi:MAG: DUF2243 domain-containing protein [Chloroflexi bacterium]|nr:DUF2243 domain-containing protein [Chloroflexota bacterium]